MSGILLYLAAAACLVTLGVLAFGVGGFGGKAELIGDELPGC